MRIYIATAFPNKAEAQYWMNCCAEMKIGITLDWTRGPTAPVGRSETTLPLEEQRHIARTDLLEGVAKANLVWVLSVPSGGTGCWVELGAALASLIPVVVSGPKRTIFASLGEQFDTHEEAFRYILSL